MLPSDLSWVTFASLVLGVSCANDFVTSGSKSFPSQFGLDRKTTIYWGNRTGFIAGIYVYTNGQSDDSADYTWVLGWSTEFILSLTTPSLLYSHISRQFRNLHVTSLSTELPGGLRR